ACSLHTSPHHVAVGVFDITADLEERIGGTPIAAPSMRVAIDAPHVHGAVAAFPFRWRRCLPPACEQPLRQRWQQAPSVTGLEPGHPDPCAVENVGGLSTLAACPLEDLAGDGLRLGRVVRWPSTIPERAQFAPLV